MALADMIAFATVAALALAAAPSDAQDVVPTRGKPASIVATADGRYAFVSETKVDAAAPAGELTPAADEDLAAGIEVFEIGGNGVWRLIGFVGLGNAGAYGLRLLPNEKVLAVGAGDRGVMFLRVADLIRGEGAPVVVPQGRHAGVFDIAATPDGRYVFSANEYGRVRGERGNVGVTATGIDADGNVHDPRLVILDEPTAGLDLPSRESLLATLARLHRRSAAAGLAPAMITVTHHLEELLPDTSNVLLLSRRGTVVASGPPAAVLTDEHLSAAYSVPIHVACHHGRYAAHVNPAVWDDLLTP